MKRLAASVPQPPAAGWKGALLAAPNGARVEEPVLGALHAEIAARIAAAAGEAQAPLLSDLCVRHDGLPEGWADAGNLLLAAPDATVKQVQKNLGHAPPADALLVLGRGAHLHQASFGGEGALIAIGDGASLYAGSASAMGRSTVVVGELTTATFFAQLDARNDGAIIVGADGMWANAVRIITDDMHAIRDMKTGRRLNGRGGRVVIGPHVWLSEQVSVIGRCRIGAGSVVGLGAIVLRDLPANSVCVGRPARRVRRGVVWTREDGV